MKNLYLLPTDKPSRLIRYTTGEYHLLKEPIFIDAPLKPSRHIYITSDEEISEGDCSFYLPFGVGRNIIINGELCFHIEAKNFEGSFTQRTYQTLDLNKKIILTTDQDLIKDGVQEVDEEFLEWFVKNPSFESIEVIKEELTIKGEIDYFNYDNGKKININAGKYKIIIPKENPKQETLVEAAKDFVENTMKFSFTSIDTRTQANRMFKCVEFGAKWQQERMYSEEEVHEIILSYQNNVENSPNHITYNKWFEQFKKK